ncbi:alpha-kinase 2 [Cricetulus griseus]
MSADSSPDKFNHSCSPQIVANYEPGVSNSEDPPDVEETRQRTEPYNPNNTQENSFHSDNTTGKQDASQHRIVHTTDPGLIGDGLGSKGSKEEGATLGHQNPKAQKYISFSLPLPEAAPCPYPGDSNSISLQPGPQVSSEDSDSDYELCPEITLTYMEEFSDDDLEYLECSDVMTDYSNAVWQRSLLGTDRDFLLESDDEEMEFNECGLGGCEHFISEMGCGPRVSGDMGPTNATTGLCSYHSQPQEVGVRSSGTSRHSPLPLHAGMTLTLGPHQDGTAKMTEPGRAPLPAASEAVENDCPGIRGETRDNPEAEEEFSSDSLQTMDKAETEAGVKSLSRGSEKSEVKQSLKSLDGERADEKHQGSRKAAPRPTRVRRPGMKANAKKQLLKDNAPKGTLDPLPKESTRHPLTGSYGGEPTQSEAGAPGWNSHIHAELCIPIPAEQDSKTPRPPADPLPNEGDTRFEGEGELFTKLSEASQTPDQTDHLQMQIQETTGEKNHLNQMPDFSLLAGEESSFTGTTTNFVYNLSKINKENASIQYLDLESCLQGPQQEARQNREGNLPDDLWEEPAHELSALEGNDEGVSQVPSSAHLLPSDSAHCREPEALSAAFSQPTASSLPLENVGSGSRGREAAWVMRCFEAGDQETCYDTMDLTVGASVDKYLPQEICPMDLELMEGQSKVCDLCSPDKTLAVLQTQGPQPAQSTYECSEDGEPATSPLPNSSFTWNMSQEASEELLPPISATQQEPFKHSSATSKEETEHSLDPRTSVSVVTEKTTEDNSQLLSSLPSLPDILLQEKEDIGIGSWAVGSKVKIITLEAPVNEIWPPEQAMNSGYKEAEVGLTVPSRGWALSDILRAGATRPEQGALGVAAWVPGPQPDRITALTVKKDTCAGDAPARHAYCSSPSSQCLGQPRLLESSVDPVEEEGLDVPVSPLEVSKSGEMESIEAMNKEQEGSQWKLCDPMFVNRFVNFPSVLESSVDPIDDRSEMECVWSEKPELSNSNTEGNESANRNTCQRADIQPAILQVPQPQNSGEIIPNERIINQNHVDREQADAKQSQAKKAKAETQAAICQTQCSGEERQRIPSVGNMSQIQDGNNRRLEEAEQMRKDMAEFISPMSPLSSRLVGMTPASVEVDTNDSTGHTYGGSEPRNHQDVLPMWKEKGTMESQCGKHMPSSSDLTQMPCTSSPKGNVTRLSISHDIEELKSEELQIAETKPLNSSHSPTMTLAFISGEFESEKAPEGVLLKDQCQKGSTLDSREKSREEQQKHVGAQTSKAPGARSAMSGSEEDKKKQEASGSGHLAAGVKKKILSRVAALRLRLEERENMRKNSILKKTPKFEKSLSRTDEKKDSKKTPCKVEGKAPVLLKKIQAEMAPDHSGNVKLSCQFAEIHEDSTIWWTKDSKSIAQVERSAGDNSSVSLAIVQAGQKDQGLYYCCLKNSYGKVTAEFNLTAEGCEEIEFSQLIFKEDVFNDSYFGDHLRGQISTEELHFGEGVHRKAFRSTVMQGLMPVFQPGHACVLKVHNAVAHGTRNNDELVQRNYKLAAQVGE